MAREHDDHVTEEDFMGDENINHEGGYGDEEENAFGSDWDEENEPEEENNEEGESGEEWGDENEEGEYHEGEEGESEGFGEAESQEEEKKPWKKYGIIGAAVVLLGGAATWVMGGHSNNQTPTQVAASHIKPGLKKPVPAFNNQTAQNPTNGFPATQKPVVAPGAQVTPPNQGPSVQPPSFANDQQASNGPDVSPPIPGGNQGIGINDLHNNKFPPPNGPYGNGFHPGMGGPNPALNGGVYDNSQGLSPYQRHQIENDASNTVLQTITTMGKGLHEDIHKTSDDEKALINKRIDELQALIMKRLDAIASGAAVHGDSSAPPSYSNPAPNPAVSDASRDQIEGIRDTLSAMRMTLESSNTAQKGQQDTIAALRSEIETLRGNQDSTPHSYSRPAPVKHKAPPRHVDEDTSSSDDAPLPTPKPAPVKKISANWKLRGYNSSNNTVVLQSPKGDYYEESIGYLAKDDSGKDLGIGKLKSIEKQDSGSYVLHTSFGDIQQGH